MVFWRQGRVVHQYTDKTPFLEGEVTQEKLKVIEQNFSQMVRRIEDHLPDLVSRNVFFTITLTNGESFDFVLTEEMLYESNRSQEQFFLPPNHTMYIRSLDAYQTFRRAFKIAIMNQESVHLKTKVTHAKIKPDKTPFDKYFEGGSSWFLKGKANKTVHWRQPVFPDDIEIETTF